MVTNISRPTTSTLLSPGQRFIADDIFASDGSSDVTVARLVRDDLGMLHVVLRDQDDREISAFVEQIELAIELGSLQPVGHSMAGIAS